MMPHRVVPEVQIPAAGDDGTGPLDKLIAEGKAISSQAEKELINVIGGSPSY